MIAGRRVKRQWFVHLDGVYRYTGDLAAALAGLGFGGPLVGALAHSGEPGQQGSGDFWKRLTEQLGPVWVYAGLAAIVVWIAVRLVTQNESVAQRATLAKQFALDNENGWARLFEVLRRRSPRDGIREINRSTQDRVQSALMRNIWPFDTFKPPMKAVQPELDLLIVEIRTTHMGNWDPPQPGQEW